MRLQVDDADLQQRVALLTTRHDKRFVAISGSAALAPAVIWGILVKAYGTSANSDLGAESPTDFLRVLKPEGRTRLIEAGPAVFRGTYLMVAPALVVCVLLTVALWRRAGDRRLANLGPLRPAFALLSMAVASGVITSLVYAVGIPDLTWWLSTSLERVTSTPKLFALAALVSMTPVGIKLYTRDLPTVTNSRGSPRRRAAPLQTTSYASVEETTTLDPSA